MNSIDSQQWLTVRQRKSLNDRGIRTLEMLCQLDREELYFKYGMRAKSVKNLEKALSKQGLALKVSPFGQLKSKGKLISMHELKKSYLKDESTELKKDFIKASGMNHLFIHYGGVIYVYEKDVAEVVNFVRQIKSEKARLERIGMSDIQFAKRRGVKLSLLRQEIKSGKWDGFITGQTISITNGDTIHFFNKQALKNLIVSDLKSLSENITYPKFSTLKEWKYRGWIKQPDQFKGTNLWELKDLKKQIEVAKAISNERFSAPAREFDDTLEKLVGEKFERIIDEYLEVRRIGSLIVDPWYGNRYGKINDLSQHRLQLNRAIYKMICNTARIKNYELVNHRNTFRQLNLDERDLFMQCRETFELQAVEKYHIDAVHKGITSDYVWHKTATIYLKPFILWQFNNVELEVDETIEMERLTFLNAKKRFKSIVEKLTFSQPEPDYKRTKVFLTREENALIFEFLKKTNTTHATAWLCGSLGGIRPEEIPLMKIEYFKNPITGQTWIDDDGFLKPDPTIKPYYHRDGSLDDTYGYVRLFLPFHATKDHNAPSDVDLGTLIPPALVNQINAYLRSVIYSVCDKQGEGYLFRRINSLHSSQLKGHYTFVYNQRANMKFLPAVKRKSLILKDARRCMNNMINRSIINVPGINQMLILRAAQVQMRHKQNGMIGSISELSYTEKIMEDEYLTIISNTLEYPLDRKELINWELDKGYRTRDEIPDDLKSEIIFVDTVASPLEQDATPVSKPSEQSMVWHNLYQDLSDEFSRLNGIMLLPAKKRKQSLAENNITPDALYEKMQGIENKMNAVKREIIKSRGA